MLGLPHDGRCARVAAVFRRILSEQGSQVAPASSPGLAPPASGAAVPPSVTLMHADLSAPLADAVAIARADLAPQRNEHSFVLNGVAGVAHRVAVGPGEALAAAWIAACGWKFGMSTFADLLARDRLPRDPRLLCKRCLPDVRLARLAELASAAAPED